MQFHVQLRGLIEIRTDHECAASDVDGSAKLQALRDQCRVSTMWLFIEITLCQDGDRQQLQHSG
jgi:hypothetical protein